MRIEHECACDDYMLNLGNTGHVLCERSSGALRRNTSNFSYSSAGAFLAASGAVGGGLVVRADRPPVLSRSDSSDVAALIVVTGDCGSGRSPATAGPAKTTSS